MSSRILVVAAATVLATAGCSDDCTSSTSSSGGECNAVTQCGCPYGNLCTLQFDLAPCHVTERCSDPLSDYPFGASQVGEYCERPLCQHCCVPGAVCLRPPGTGGVVQYCYEMCRDSTDCSLPGSECTIHGTLDDMAVGCSSVPAPYMLCTVP